MIIDNNPITRTTSETHPMKPNWTELVKIQQEAPGISTYWLKFIDPDLNNTPDMVKQQFRSVQMLMIMIASGIQFG